MNGSASLGVPPRPHLRAWLLNPYLLILIGAMLDAVGEVLLKMGADSAATAAWVSGPLGWLAPLTSLWTWIGIISYIANLVIWLYVLRTVPLSIAFPLVSVVHVMVPVGAHFFLGEHIPPRLWAGVGLIFLGVLIIARPLMKAEEKL